MSDLTRNFTKRDDAAPLSRPRRYVRTVVLRIVGVLVLVVAIGWFGGWLYLHLRYRDSVASVAAEVERIRAAGEPITPEDMFAWHRVPVGTTDATQAWLRAFGVMIKVKFPEKTRLPFVGKGEPRDLSDSEPQSLMRLAKEYLAAHQETIAATREAAALEGECRYPINFNDGRTGTFPHAVDTAELMRILQLRFRVALEERVTEQAIDSIQIQLALARTWDHEPSEIFQWVRSSMHNIAIDEIDDLLRALPLTDEQLADLADRLNQIPFEAPLRIGLIGERAFGFHAFHHLPTLVVDDWTTPPTGKGKLRRPGDCFFYLLVLRETIEAVDLPSHEGRARVKELSDLINRKVTSKNSFEKYSVVLTAQMAPQFPMLFDAVAQTQALRNSAVAGIAFRRYELKYGKPPRSLEALVPEFLAEVPVDAFAAGAPLKCVIEEGQYSIYSVGLNGADDRALLSDPESFDDAGFVADLAVPMQPVPGHGETEGDGRAQEGQEGQP